MSVEIRIALLIGLFAVGFICRRVGWLRPPHAGRMLKLVIYAGLPALFVATVSRIPLTASIMAFPASSLIVILVTMGVAFVAGRALGLERAQRGTMMVCGMSINNAFLFPFVIVGWGQAAFAQLALFDLGHTIAQGTVIYIVAAAFGGHVAGPTAILRRLLGFPVLWALVVALALNVGGVALPGWLLTGLTWGGNAIMLLISVALGVLFDARLLFDRRVMTILALRPLLGLALGLGCVAAFGLEGTARSVVLLGAAAPVGFTAVVLSEIERLDRGLAASAASVSVLLGLGYVPLALWLLRS